MKIYKLENSSILKISMEKCWSFFSNPKNLTIITPKSLDFCIISNIPEEMYEGMIIEYTLKPFFGIAVHWVTEITHMKKYEYFVDEQRFGPYKFWHHQHIFKETKEGILMTDTIHYALPFSFLGRMVNFCVVREKLREIFEFRKKAITELFVVE